MASKPGYTGLTKVIADELDAMVLKQNGTAIGSGTGDVVGPASSVNNEIAQFSGTTGKLLKRGPVINRLIKTPVSIDFAAAGGSGWQSLTITVTGAQVNDTVILNPRDNVVASGAPARGVFAWARVSAADTVTVQYDSPGSGDPAAVTFDVTVIG